MKSFSLFLILLLYFLAPSNSFSQNIVMSNDISMSLMKSEIVAIKITISVYGDSVANEILMGRKYLPGPISIKFVGNNIKKIVFYEAPGRKWDKDIKAKFTKEILNSIFFTTCYEQAYYSSKEALKAAFEKTEDSIMPFSYKANYHVLIVYSNRERILKEKCHGDYKYIDFVKDLIKEYDQKEIKDLDGNVYR